MPWTAAIWLKFDPSCIGLDVTQKGILVPAVALPGIVLPMLSLAVADHDATDQNGG